MFVHLNLHSIYSAMRGLLSLSDIVKLAKSVSMNRIALTDINGVWGIIKFIQHCSCAGIKPIVGSNIITDKEEVLILVENQYGYENLCKIISKIHDNPNHDISDILKKYNLGVFVLAHSQELLRKLYNFIPNTHLFIELRPGINELFAKRLSKELKLEIIATGDVYFKQRSDYKSHKILNAIYHNMTLQELDQTQYKSDQHWFRNEKQMINLFPNSLEALNNSQYLAERCKTDWSFINTIFPGLSLKDTHYSNLKLKKKVYEGSKKRYTNINDQIRSRINYELELISQKGFAPYFLIVEDIVNQTQSTIGRGSAAASIVSYCLFITQVDPLKYTLRFERFIHPERDNMPDIDVDFPWDERDDILDYIFKKYGEERTAMVANQIFLRPRSAIREVGKVYGLSNEEIKSITKRSSRYRVHNKDFYKLISDDLQYSNTDIDKNILNVLEESKKIINVFSHTSIHPGGIIIVPDEIRKYVPVLTAPKGLQIVEWEKDQVEDSGLLKIDILGNRSLAVVRDTIRCINSNYGESIQKDKYINYHKIHPVGDEKTELLMKSGKTMGVFYIESPATRQLLKKARLVDFEHVVIYSSIIRPAANHYTKLMLSRIHGKEWALIHPDLGFLRESYGIMVYEEQVSMTVMVMAGLTYSEAELLRKDMSRNSMKYVISSWEKKFTKRALNRGYSFRIINKVWDMIKSFVGYSFCKPHSASYAMLSFTCAYLKAHYPAEFLASVISNQGGYYSSYAYMSEAKRLGIKILKPDINKSIYHWYGTLDKIQMGFMSIRGLKYKAINLILDERKSGHFESLDDFLFRVVLNLSDAIALTNAGCFKSISSKSGHQQIAYQVAGFYMQKKGLRKSFQSISFEQDLNIKDKYQLELNTFGFPISNHPISRYREILSHKIRYARDIPNYLGKSIYLMGLYITKKESITRKSEPMQFLTLEDETDIYECYLFPNVFKKFGDMFHWETLFIIRGKVEQSFGVYSINIEKVTSLQDWVQRFKKNL